MPLDPVAQRYAQALFVDKLEELTRKHGARAAEVRAALAQRGMLPHTAGHYHSEMTRIGIEHIGEIADARVDSLLAAYTHAKLPIDDQAVVDVHREAVQFCEAQARNLTANIREQIGRAGMPPGVAEQMAEAIARGISAIQARIYRKLSAKRDEEIMAARAVPQPEMAGPDGAGRTGNLLIQLWHSSAKWQWYAGFFVGAFAMISIQEYLFSVLLLFLSALSLLSKLMHLEGRIILKSLGGAGIACAFILFLFIALAIKAKSPWSHLQKSLTDFVVFKRTAPPPAPIPPSQPTSDVSHKELAQPSNDASKPPQAEHDQAVRNQLDKLNRFDRKPPASSPKKSLKQRALLLANKIQIFYGQMADSGRSIGIVSPPLTKEDVDSNTTKENEFHEKVVNSFREQFEKELVGIIDEMQHLGLDVTEIGRRERAHDYWMIAYIPVELRELASQIDEQGRLIH